MEKKSFLKSERVPPPYQGIQVNHCKNPLCPNFGLPASLQNQSRGRYADPLRQDDYIRQMVDGEPNLLCKCCGAYLPLKSNLGIYEEFSRFSAYLNPKEGSSCPNPDCVNHNKSLENNKVLYKSKGRTPSRKSQRYMCKSCGKTFSVAISTIARQRLSHRTRYMFKALCNKNPLRCISDIFDVDMRTVYDRIDFIYERCCEFAANRERRLLYGMDLPKLYIGVDRQYYAVNWRSSEDRRTIILKAIGAADNNTGYVFSMDLNYDHTINPVEIEADAEKINDSSKFRAFRRYSRLWLKRDFEDLFRKEGRKKPTRDFNIPHVDLTDEIEKKILEAYKKSKMRNDVEASDEFNTDIQLPLSGVQTRDDYTMYGHFFHLRKLLYNAKRICFFLDQESGIRAACFAAFWDKIISRSCDAFFVKINREWGQDSREYFYFRGKWLVDDYLTKHPELTRSQARKEIIKNKMKEMKVLGHYGDKWLKHPFPTMAEPEKQVCHLTDFNDYSEDHLAWLYNKSSMHAINVFFANIRRKLSMLERPIATPSSLNAKWYGYSPSNPAMVNKLLTIHRVWYNYAKRKRKMKITPAMKLGLCKSAD